MSALPERQAHVSRSSESSFASSRSRQVEDALNRLEIVSVKIKRYGHGLVFLIGGVLVAQGLGSIAYVVQKQPDTTSFPMVAAISSLCLTLLGLAILFIWDLQYRLGMIVFEEVSDEYEWQHRSLPYGNRASGLITNPSPGRSESTTHTSRPKLYVRVRLRAFLAQAELPFVSHSHSASRYAILLLVLFFNSLVLMFWFSRSLYRLNWFI